MHHFTNMGELPHKSSLTPPHLIEVPGAKSGEWVVMYMCASGVYNIF
jgi:hypothetical protein